MKNDCITLPNRILKYIWPVSTNYFFTYNCSKCINIKNVLFQYFKLYFNKSIFSASQAGEQWQDEEDPCISYVCEENGIGEVVKAKSVINCTECPRVRKILFNVSTVYIYICVLSFYVFHVVSCFYSFKNEQLPKNCLKPSYGLRAHTIRLSNMHVIFA